MENKKTNDKKVEVPLEVQEKKYSTIGLIFEGYCELKSNEKVLFDCACEQLKMNPHLEEDYIMRLKNY